MRPDTCQSFDLLDLGFHPVFPFTTSVFGKPNSEKVIVCGSHFSRATTPAKCVPIRLPSQVLCTWRV